MHPPTHMRTTSPMHAATHAPAPARSACALLLPPARSAGVLLLVAALCASCGDDPPPPETISAKSEDNNNVISTTVDVDAQEPPEVSCATGRTSYDCYGRWAAHCGADGELRSLRNCLAEGLTCAPNRCEGDDETCLGGCLPCVPGATSCTSATELLACDSDGLGLSVARNCNPDEGEWCDAENRSCSDLCAEAEKRRSYLGCEYWAIPTINSSLQDALFDPLDECGPFPFAIVMANGHAFTASVRIVRPGGQTTAIKIDPGGVEAVELPCVPALTGRGDRTPSSLVPDGAFHITSDIPITAYQFNPLEFAQDTSDGEVFSHTNDASLLLPVHALTANYTVMSRASMFNQFVEVSGDGNEDVLDDLSSPGFAAVVGTQDSPTTVEVHTTAYTRASLDGTIEAHAPGDVFSVSLRKGDVLQLLTAKPSECDPIDSDRIRGTNIRYCRVPNTYDLTGTRIRADAPVGVVSGHDCAFVPANRWACDHLEETMFPQETWGKELLIAWPQPATRAGTAPMLVRLMSGTDDNRIVFDPEVHAPITLSEGEWFEFETRADFRVIGKHPLQVAQYLVGQDWEGIGSSGSFADSDPAMALAIPREQWRDDYVILVPETFGHNYISLITQENQTVLLDGGLLRGFTPIGDTGMAVMRTPVEPGQHRLTSGTPFSLQLYGYATYTSYMVPGGLDSTLLQDVD